MKPSVPANNVHVLGTDNVIDNIYFSRVKAQHANNYVYLAPLRQLTPCVRASYVHSRFYTQFTRTSYITMIQSLTL